MSADDSLLFIDANKYLDLYRMDQGKKLLDLLRSQVGCIFVTQQIVNEVKRNKIKVATEFLLKEKPKELKLEKVTLPNQLFSKKITDKYPSIINLIEAINQEIAKANNSQVNIKNQVNSLMFDIMKEIKCSEDEVSKTLSLIFDKAVPHSSEELQRARVRKELGNPPGKITDSIGDQLTWEQILTHFEGKKRLWIITKDRDYSEVYNNETFLNPFLYDELCSISSEPEVYLFEHTLKGIQHFVKTTGVKVEQSVTPQDVEEIEKEEESLSDLTHLNFLENLRQQISQQFNQQHQMSLDNRGYYNLLENSKLQFEQQENNFLKNFRQQIDRLNQQQNNFLQNIQLQVNQTDQFLEEAQEEKNEKPPASPSSSHEDDTGEKKDDEAQTE
jgi:hypothetical protein